MNSTAGALPFAMIGSPSWANVFARMNAQQQASRFGDYLAELRAQFKPKRNFINLLDAMVHQVKGA